MDAASEAGQDREATHDPSEHAIDDQGACVCHTDPPEPAPPLDECPALVMTSSSSLQPSAVQAIDPSALTVLGGLIALHGQGTSFSSQVQGGQEDERPLDEERMEGPDLRDPRTKGAPCYGNHKVTNLSKAYKGSVSGSNQYASWTGCEVCQLRLPTRQGWDAMEPPQIAPLAKDVINALRDLPPDTEAYPSNREIAAENSALARLEHLRRLRKGAPSKPIETEEDRSKGKGQTINKTTKINPARPPWTSRRSEINPARPPWAPRS